MRDAEDLFHEALGRKGTARIAFLDETCGEDVAIRERVQTLLAASEQFPGFLDSRPPVVEGPTSWPGAISGVFGPYQIVRELDHGGQGRVYLATDPRLGRRVALKLLSFSLTTNPATLERFHREAEAASRLDHPAICTIYESGEVDGVPYIAMRYVEGVTLAERLSLARDGGTPLPGVPQVLELFEDLARGLHVAHEAGLVHRDVKPRNVMVTADGTPVILDFGLVHEIETDRAALTLTGDVVGTPYYMSPEQLSETSIEIDRRSDVYSLGVTLYECLTLERPFDGPFPDAIYQKILHSEPTNPRRFNPRISRDLAVVLLTALDKDRERRYATTFDFAEDLRRVREHEPIRARPASSIH